MTIDVHAASEAAPRVPSAVLLYPARAYPDGETHARRTHDCLASAVAGLLGTRYDGVFDPARDAGRHCYFVPNDTLAPVEVATALGIASEQDFFGGAVPHAFVGSKCISHGLDGEDAARPVGWNEALAPMLDGHVVPGVTAFDAGDAARAGRRLLAAHGRVRLKRPAAMGGQGQAVVEDPAALMRALGDLDPERLAREGLVLEINLADPITWSVGQVRVGDLVAAYYGTQRMTRDNAGMPVYGGSTIDVVRGDFAALLALELPDAARIAVRQAQAYHQAARDAYPTMLASRSNYDVIQGRDSRGTWRSGVLEQSWRIGGASGAEIAALQVFRREPGRHRVRASTHEAYGAEASCPADAEVHFQGHDGSEGPMIKYVRVDADADA